ncbi:glycosyltransferase family A protein [Leptospirillum ferriphilum]|jgi:glycosyltransferase involved in cell wall biosynthesis|uniref:glycosyltransferase family A protein n=1 Tax=Leptospirillum ferriphilum TaxID=178606 RepID=UPI003EE7521B
MSQPEISVIITMYREGPMISETIESILSQTFTDFEIILVDNNADPETLRFSEAYVRKFPDKIHLTKETTQGIASAKNKGFQESRGRFIIFHDGDDLSHSNRLATQYSFLEKHPELAFVGSWHDLISHDNQLLQKNISETLPSFWAEIEKIFNQHFQAVFRRPKTRPIKFPLISTCFLRKEAVQASGGHDERLNPRWFEENEFLLKVFDQGDVGVIPEALLSYRKHSPEGSRIMKDQMNWVGKTRHLDTFFNILKERYADRSGAEKLLAKLRSHFLRYTSQFLLQHKNGSHLGRIGLKRALESSPDDELSRKLLIKSYFPKALYPKIFWFDHWMTEPLPLEVNESFIRSLFA